MVSGCYKLEGIGFRLKEERDKTELNQVDFAEKCGAAKRTQGYYEKGKRFPDALYLANAAKLGCDVQYILTGLKSLNVSDVGSPQLSVVEKPTSLNVQEAIDLVVFSTKEAIHTAYQVRRMQNKLDGLKMDAYGSIKLITKAAKLVAHCELTGDSPSVVFEQVINEAMDEDKESRA
jgi:transcriptional regulator with XRE-family HTH domain